MSGVGGGGVLSCHRYGWIDKYLVLIFYCPDKRKPLCTVFPPSQVKDLGQGAVTSQQGFLNLKEVNIIWILHVNIKCDVHV